jgi:O-antigen/teichoic acid export membrane protein
MHQVGPQDISPDSHLDERCSTLFSTSRLKEGLPGRAVRGGVFVMVAEVGSALLRVASIAVLARILIPEDFGLLAMVTALTVIAERFKDFGLGDATVQASEITHYQVTGLFWVNLAVCLGIALFLASLARGIAWFYQEPRLTAVSLVIASTFLFSGLVIQHQALLRRQLRFGGLAIIELSSTLLSLLVAIFLAMYGFGYWALVAREFARALAVFIGTWLLCPWRPGPPERRVGLRQFLAFGKHITGFNLVHFLSRSLDKVVIGRLHGPYWLGLYENAYRMLALPVSQMSHPVSSVALPTLSAVQKDLTSFNRYYYEILQLLSFFSMPIVIFFGVFADIIIELVLGSRWMGAVPICRAMAIGAFIEPALGSLGPAIIASGKTREYLNLAVICSCIRMACLGIGSIWGPIGVALGVSLAVYPSLFVHLVYGIRTTPIRAVIFLRKIVPPASCSLLMGLVLVAVRKGVDWSSASHALPVFLLIGGATYLASWLLIPGGKEMLGSYRSYVSRLLER